MLDIQLVGTLVGAGNKSARKPGYSVGTMSWRPVCSQPAVPEPPTTQLCPGTTALAQTPQAVEELEHR
jgi:hypothetical protein